MTSIDYIAQWATVFLFSLLLASAFISRIARRLAWLLLTWTDAREAALKAWGEAWKIEGRRWGGTVLTREKHGILCGACRRPLTEKTPYLDAANVLICRDCYIGLDGLDALRTAEVRR